jgi:quercetin dioxygenase-like cupin family protein
MTPIHATSGTDRRAGHIVSGGGGVFCLADEVGDLLQDLRRSSGGRSGKTLAKAAGLRVTLVVLESGVTLDPEAAAGGASVHVLDGRIAVQCDAQRCELGPGELIALGQNLREPVQAIERSAFLLTVAWPEGAGAWAQEARAGHL